MNVTVVAGARPNFIKVAGILKAIRKVQKDEPGIKYRLVHTGQHYDRNMSSDFFGELDIPDPDINLGAGGGTQSEQTAAIMIGFERELSKNAPDVVLVVGDVTSTMACTIVAKKLGIPVVHVEAGIRSGDMSMPEEINRIVTDSICDHFFTTTEIANENLYKQGIARERVHLVGNTMIDTLYQNLDRIRPPMQWSQSNLSSGNYFLMTLHRPSSVDNVQNLRHLLEVVMNNTGDFPVIFPVHPRTRKILSSISFDHPRLLATEPLPYLEFIYLVKNAKAIITDSGGITEEATVLGVPCLTMRSSTERPETITIGSNELVGTDALGLVPHLRKVHLGQWKESSIPALWDGNTSVRIIDKLIELYTNNEVRTHNLEIHK